MKAGRIIQDGEDVSPDETELRCGHHYAMLVEASEGVNDMPCSGPSSIHFKAPRTTESMKSCAGGAADNS